MQYRENPGNKDQLSILGYGCLRYSKKGTAIDQEKAEREMAAAVEAGVNYLIPHILTVEVKHAWESSWQKAIVIR